MRARPTTTVTIYQAASIDTYSGARIGEVVVATGVVANLVERPATRPRTGAEGRAVQDPASGTPRILRVFSCRLPAETPVSRESRLRDDRDGRWFAVKSVRRHAWAHANADVILELTAVDAEDP